MTDRLPVTSPVYLVYFRRLYGYHLPREESRDVSIYKMTNQAPLGSMIRSMFDLPHHGSAPWCFEKQMVRSTTNMAYFYPCWTFLDIHGDFLLMLRPGRERRLPNLESLFIMGSCSLSPSYFHLSPRRSLAYHPTFD